MRYRCDSWFGNQSAPRPNDFLSVAAMAYLKDCDAEIFNDWNQHFPSEKSTANVMSRTVITKLSIPRFALATKSNSGYDVLKAFHHRSSSQSLFVDIFRRFNHANVQEFLLLSQSNNYKSKFLYDSATMTTESLITDFADFVAALKIQNRPTLHFLTFEDLEFATDILQKGRRQFIVLLK